VPEDLLEIMEAMTRINPRLRMNARQAMDLMEKYNQSISGMPENRMWKK
jgi:hypothetical protein